MISGMTMTYVEEGVGIVRAAAAAGLPVSVSFTVETDGRLPSGEPLREAVERLDAETGGAALYQMINCAHPTHFAAELAGENAWLGRIGGVRANASRRSHAELDEATEHVERVRRHTAANVDQYHQARTRADVTATGLTQETADTLYTRAHDLKGLGGTYGFPLVSRLEWQTR